MIEDNINFYVLNVGQGDSHVIHFPGNEAAIVIDPFNSRLINELLHNRLKIKSLPFILISHGDMDHMAEIEKVIKKCLEGPNNQVIKPGYVFYNYDVLLKVKKNKSKELENDFKRLKALADANEVRLRCIFADEDSSGPLKKSLDRLGLAGKILYPQYQHMIDVFTKEDFNLASVVMLLTFAHKKMLYTGDLPYAGWEGIEKKEDLKSDVFKVPHHGGKISGNSAEDMKAILDRVKPNFALVSVGSDNSPKHPLPEVIQAIVNHSEKPHLLCTQMTDQCSKVRLQRKEAKDKFYKTKIKESEDYEIMQLGSDNGTGCAGTIRLTFSRNSEIAVLPSLQHHSLMLKTIFNNDGLLCRLRQPCRCFTGQTFEKV